MCCGAHRIIRRRSPSYSAADRQHVKSHGPRDGIIGWLAGWLSVNFMYLFLGIREALLIKKKINKNHFHYGGCVGLIEETECDIVIT